MTILEAKNATDRTSFLQAVMAAMGSDRFTLKGDTDEGRVEPELDGTVVERRFERRKGRVQTSGEGYLDDPELAELFAFLLEENEARRAVLRGDELQELLTRPIDTAEIEAEIERLQANKRDVEDHLSRNDEREDDRLTLARRREELGQEQSEDELAAVEDEIEEVESLVAEREDYEDRRTVSKNVFELHMVREAESGEAYEGTIENLSESEREVVGLVSAPAGYLVHGLHEAVPVMVLDSLEAIDSDRIARFVDYFADYPKSLVVALLPEDAAAIDVEHETVTII